VQTPSLCRSTFLHTTPYECHVHCGRCVTNAVISGTSQLTSPTSVGPLRMLFCWLGHESFHQSTAFLRLLPGFLASNFLLCVNDRSQCFDIFWSVCPSGSQVIRN
jgi:hypothetical protein